MPHIWSVGLSKWYNLKLIRHTQGIDKIANSKEIQRNISKDHLQGMPLILTCCMLMSYYAYFSIWASLSCYLNKLCSLSKDTINNLEYVSFQSWSHIIDDNGVFEVCWPLSQGHCLPPEMFVMSMSFYPGRTCYEFLKKQRCATATYPEHNTGRPLLPPIFCRKNFFFFNKSISYNRYIIRVIDSKR